MTEIKDSDREIHHFRMRLTAAGGARVRLLRRCWWRASSGCRWSSTTNTMRRPRTTASRIVPIVPNRGLIVDRNGVVLARNYSAYTLEITPSKLQANLDSVIDELAKLVDDRAEGPQALQAPAGRVARTSPACRCAPA